jgi:uncharacterized membrane protein
VSGQRLLGIDVARGVAVLAMIQTHAYDGWVLDSERAGIAFRATRVLGTLPLPLFLLLAGLGLALRAHTEAARGIPAEQTRARLVRDALKILLVGYGLSALYALLNGAHSIDAVLRPDVLHAIGLSLLLLSLLGIGGAPRLGSAAVMLTLLPVALSPSLSPLGRQTSPAFAPFVGLLVEVPGLTHMPLVPLLSFCATGAGLGLWLARESERDAPSLTAAAATSPGHMPRKLWQLAGLGSALLLIGVASSDWARAQGMMISRSHPSIAFNVMDLDGRALLALALAALSAPWLGRATPALVACGRHSLVLYGLHLPFCYGRLARPIRHALHKGSATLLVLALSAACVGVALALEHLRVSRARK